MCVSLLLLSCVGGDEDDEALSVGNYYLTSLNVVGYDIDFYSTKLGVYEVDVDADTDEVDITIDYDSAFDINFEQRSSNNFVSYPLTQKTFSVSLSEGTNTLLLTLSGSEYDVETVYSININKPSNSAYLGFLSLLDSSGTSTLALDLEPSFDRDIFDYTVSVDYDTCAYALVAIPEYIDSTMNFDGERIDSNTIYYQSLIEGRNDHEILVISEDGEVTRQYTLTINRETGSNDEIRSESRLLGLSIQEADIDYACGVSAYAVILDLETANLSFDFDTLAEGARVYWQDREISVDETFVLPIEDDAGVIEFTVESVDQSETQSYTVSYIRRSTNLVEVETVEELVYALENAKPNDEIRLDEGEYDMSASGLDNLYFYTDRSGTANEPIYLSTATTGDEIVLKNTRDADAVFYLEGDYWQVSNIVFEGGSNGIVLSNANNNEFRGVRVSDSATRGLWIKSGSDDNRFVFSEIRDIGDQQALGESAITIGEDVFSWPTDYLPPTNNQIRQNTFSLLATGVALQVEEGVDGSEIHYNAFIETRDKYNVVQDHTMRIQGQNTSISYNLIQHELDYTLSSLITFVAPDVPVSDNYVDHAWVYQNNADLSDEGVPFVSAGADYRVYVEDNQRRDEGIITYQGDGIIDEGFETPHYYIQIANDERKCLGVDQVEEGNDDYFMVVEECAPQDTMLWSFHVDDGEFVAIKNNISDNLVLRSYSCFLDDCASFSDVSNDVFLFDDVGAYEQRWAIDMDGDHVVIRSKFALAYSLTVSGEDLNNGNIISVSPYLGATSQQFRLVPMGEE